MDGLEIDQGCEFQVRSTPGLAGAEVAKPRTRRILRHRDTDTMPMRLIPEAPAFQSQQWTDEARMLNSIAWGTMAVVSTLLLFVALVQPSVAGRAAIVVITVNVLGLITLAISRSGNTRVASWILVLGLILLVGLLAVNAGGIRSPGVGAYVTLVIMGGLLLGERGGIVVGFVCAAIAGLLLLAELRGVLPPQTTTYTAPALWMLACLYIGIVITLQRLATRTVQDALNRARSELDERRKTERQHEELLGELHERVKELRLLHETARLIQRERSVGPQLFAELVQHIPRAWQHDDVCAARIAYGDIEAESVGWRDSPWKLSHSFTTSVATGVIEVVYLEERASRGGPMFLPEEAALLQSVAELLTGHLEREASDESRRGMEDQLRQSQKMEALGRLAGGVAHDFNNLLTVIDGYCEFVMRDLAPGHHHADLKEISGAARRASQLTRQLLAFSRHQVMSTRIISPNETVEGMGNMLRRLIGSHIEFRMDLDAEVGTVRVDPGQLEQVIMNLAVNARDAMPRGGRLAIQTSTAVFAEDVLDRQLQLAPGRYVVIGVSDTGEGMSEEVRARIFEPFFTTKEEGHGTGLGLATVFGIARQSSGAIWVHSERGAGTTFKLYLPWVGQTVETEAVAHVAPELLRGDEVVVLIDDDDHVRALAERALSERGYSVVSFADGAAAIAYADTGVSAPHLLITDVVMRGMRGPEIAARFREVWPAIGVLFITGYTDHVLDAVVAPDVLQKPFAPSVLLRTVRGVLDRAVR